MEIIRNELSDEYCSFVFGVLDMIDNELLNKKCYIDFNKEKLLFKISGYLGELLTNTFIIMKKAEGFKLKELTVLLIAKQKVMKQRTIVT